MASLLKLLLRALLKLRIRMRPPTIPKPPRLPGRPGVSKKIRDRFSKRKVCATGNCPPAPPKLNAAQAANLKRFEGKFAKGIKVTVKDTPGGGKHFRAEVPGKVPGSKAVYEKQVDALGNTTSVMKTTYAPDGSIIHIKPK
ncbi:MAG TPA: hypothetical protein VHG93_23050 [Longimicrobium sp.]|nr:hypothetical protein [Longimicrobium sp.]